MSSRTATFASWIFLGLALAVFLKIQPWSLSHLVTAFAPGEHASPVPGVVQDMKTLAATRQDRLYELSAELAENDWVLQRASEYLYPVRLGKSRLKFMLAERTAPAGCVLLAREGMIALHDCAD